ncbi:glycosyltransferase family 2 protein [Halorussus ruber]|uniref:glycosyltransferase family 2 protein n=1 Tax=Halorussus ruber TaxID=1126238 RepID=UPI0010932523|nr:glycosyltransferase [Halorussus ruber]
MTVSVVLPTYHRASVLGDAVESVLGQRYADLERLVVDDGDDEATPKVVSSFGDDRLRYVCRVEGSGVAALARPGVQWDVSRLGSHVSVYRLDGLAHERVLDGIEYLDHRFPLVSTPSAETETSKTVRRRSRWLPLLLCRRV